MEALTLGVFVFATIGVKCVLGAVCIYYLLPGDGRCHACGDHTLPLAGSPLLGWVGRVCRVQHRLCLGCGRSALARRSPEVRLFVGDGGGAGQVRRKVA